MAKKPTAVKVDAKAARKSVANQTTLNNKKRRLERHLKNHPNDVQSAEGFKGTSRKASVTKGNFPAQKFIARDAAGNVVAKY